MTPEQLDKWISILNPEEAKVVNYYLDPNGPSFNHYIKDLEPFAKRAELFKKLCYHYVMKHVEVDVEYEASIRPHLIKHAPFFQSLVNNYNYEGNPLDAKLLTTPNFIRELCDYVMKSECDDLALQAWFQELSNQLVINNDVTPDTADQMYL